MGWYYDYKPYVPVAQRRAQAAREVERRRKAGQKIAPVIIQGQKIAKSFWGLSWCTNLERYSDYENRLPRGRTYVRNGSVVDLQIAAGKVTALVSGSELYTVKITVAPLPRPRWAAFKERCRGAIGSLVELLQGKLSTDVMALATDPKEGLFPAPVDIKLSCSCPDGAYMCKHVAAVMYGVANRLDVSPELLFVLRGVNHEELIEQAIPASPMVSREGSPTIAADDLGSIFGIEIETTVPAPKTTAKASAAPKPKASAASTQAAPKTSAKAATPRKAPAAPSKATAAPDNDSRAREIARKARDASAVKQTAAKQADTAPGKTPKAAKAPATTGKRAPAKKTETTAGKKEAGGKASVSKTAASSKRSKSPIAARKK